MTSETQRPRREGRRSSPRALTLPQSLTVKQLADLIDKSPIDVIKQLMRNGIMAATNQVIDNEVAGLVTAAYGIRTKEAEPVAATAALSSETTAKDQDGATLVTQSWARSPSSSES